MIRCPYCLKSTHPKTEIRREKQGDPYETYVCSECEKEIPPEYIIENGRVQKLSIGMVGFRGHGKTTYLSALFYLLHDMCPTIWNNFVLLSLNKEALDRLHEKKTSLLSGNLPEATPTNFPVPAIVEFRNIPTLGTYFVSFYDTGGEVFEDPASIRGPGLFVAYSDVVLFLISIANIYSKENDRWARELDRLLDIYIRAIRDMHIGRKKQHLVVVFSKADLLLEGKPELSKSLKEYIEQGDYKKYKSLNEDNLRLIISISREIENWLEINRANLFINLARDNFKSVEYTMVSSLGAAPKGDKLEFRLTPKLPKRVLDPFLVALYKTRKRSFLNKLLRKLS